MKYVVVNRDHTFSRVESYDMKIIDGDLVLTDGGGGCVYAIAKGQWLRSYRDTPTDKCCQTGDEK